MKKSLFICIILFSFLHTASAQYEEEPFKVFGFSLNAGLFKANKYVANYYNGSYNNVNKIDYVLGNSYRYNEIKTHLLNGRDFGLYELPSEMRYKIATSVGLKFYMNFNASNAVFIEVHQVNLTATDIFTLEIDSVNFTSEPSLRVCSIWGKEGRTMIDFGYRHNFEQEGIRRWFYEIGFNATNTKVIENKINIAGKDFSIMDEGNYIPGQPTYDPVPQTAIGIGIIGSFGIEFFLSKQASVDIGINMRLQDINLQGYKNFHANFCFYARLNFLAF